MTDTQDFRTRPDGSIDTAHYMARGREMRSAAFFDLLRKLRRPFARPATALARSRPATARAAIEPVALHPAAG